MKVAQGDNFNASPKHPQSSTGIHVALKNVSTVKNVIIITETPVAKPSNPSVILTTLVVEIKTNILNGIKK